MNDPNWDAATAAILEHLRHGTFDDFTSAGEAVRWCSSPITLRGTGILYVEQSTGVIVRDYDPGPSGIKGPCRNRRHAVCPACAQQRGRDEFHAALIGLEGGRMGIPKSVSTHPKIFITLTLPGVGSPVHRALGPDRPCHPEHGVPRLRCRHGNTLICAEVHAKRSRIVGTPLCVDCFNVDQLVLGNALVPKLWSRTMLRARRELGRLNAVSSRATESVITLSGTKIAETQRSAAIHLHAIVRADARRPGQPPAPPPEPFTYADTLALAFRLAAMKTRLPSPTQSVAGPLGGEFGWGPQMSVTVIPSTATADAERDEDDSGTTPRAAASYIAKYIGLDIGTTLDRQGVDGELAPMDPLAQHHIRLREACVRLSRLPELAHLNLHQRIASFGYPAQLSSRSRSYSTSLSALRAERQRYIVENSDSPLRDPNIIAVSNLAYAGNGWNSDGESAYAAQQATQRIAAARDASKTRAQTPPDDSQSATPRSPP